MNWTGAPSEREPLGIRASVRHSVWRYERMRRARLCGCAGCIAVHWAWLAANDDYAYAIGSSTSACKHDDPSNEWAPTYLARLWDRAKFHYERAQKARAA